MSHWAEKYIGAKWKSGARGPVEFDCWGLVWHIRKTVFGRTDPEYPGVGATIANRDEVNKLMTGELDTFTRIDTPTDGCIVAFYQGEIVIHVGIYAAIDNGVILHTNKETGAVAQPIASINRNQYQRFEYYD